MNERVRKEVKEGNDKYGQYTGSIRVKKKKNNEKYSKTLHGNTLQKHLTL